MQQNVEIKKVDKELQVVYGEVYPSMAPDSDNDFMRRDKVRKMAHDFLRNGELSNIDIQHDGNFISASVVESWFVEEASDLYRKHSWAVAVKIDDKAVWELVKDGKLNGFSMEASGWSTEKTVKFEVPESITGETIEADGHVHSFIVYFDKEGRFAGGETNSVSEHKHEISKGTATDKSDEHSHRFAFLNLEYEEHEEETNS